MITGEMFLTNIVDYNLTGNPELHRSSGRSDLPFHPIFENDTFYGYPWRSASSSMISDVLRPRSASILGNPQRGNHVVWKGCQFCTLVMVRSFAEETGFQPAAFQCR